jgi:saccharopine dehydrogenase-like NADP-dependent oxidoreductase
MEVDLTVMRVEVEGELDGVETRLRWDLLDRLDPATGFSSMARTTGFTASVVTQLIYNQTISEHGVFAPEQIVSEGDRLDTIMRLLADRGVVYDAHIQTRGDTNG